MKSTCAVVPVKDGERYLAELLDALEREGVDEVLVIDSGSRDRSLAIARAAGVAVLELSPREFGHGRTRNLGAQHTSGELICFLTQDATPCKGWLEAYREAFTLDERIGAAYGPHLPRPDTSPMIARELNEFFATFSPEGKPTVQRDGDATFLSNVNACYARACWQEIEFRDIGYAEDQAFGADMLAAGWSKVFHPQAAVLHAHDYGTFEFMRRYFDEYRGLRESTGHVEPFELSATARTVSAKVAADRRWMADRGMTRTEQVRWGARALVHHGGRSAFSALGSRAEHIPGALQRVLSLESRSTAQAPAGENGARRPGGEIESPPALPPAEAIPKCLHQDDYDVIASVRRNGPAGLLAPVPSMSERERLRIALIIPPFARGSGGHNTLFQILSRLEARGHTCSVWLADYHNQRREFWPARLRAEINEYFAPLRGPVYKGFDAWQGADVAVATGWQTVHAMLRLPNCRARAYIVNDHEPDFYAASVERVFAQDTYRYDLHCIAASPWLRDLLIDRYDASADSFELGVDHTTYRPLPVDRQSKTVVYYSRHATPRRAVPVGLMALTELQRRIADLRIVLFGTDRHLFGAFPYEHAGVLTPPQLSRLYSEATAGLCLSLTNFSLMPKEMLACGLPCVELAGVSAESIFGEHGPLQLAPLDPIAIADALEPLITDRDHWQMRSREGIAFVASHTWDRATSEVEAGLRHALRERETGPDQSWTTTGAAPSVPQP